MPVRVVNMIPNVLSSETNRDSEPNVSVSGRDSQLLVATAFTPDPAASGSGPVFVSTDGGENWNLVVIVPGGNQTSDITLRFAGASDTVYAGILRQGTTTMDILRKTNIASAGLMSVLLSRTNDDQPYVSAIRPLGGGVAGLDKVYVAHNRTGAGTQSALSDTSQDAETAAAPAGFASQALERRTTAGQDGPCVRIAIHPIGQVYAAFFRYTATDGMPGGVRTRDVIVCRDDNWAQAAAPFSAISDPSDGLAGVIVVSNSQANFNSLLGTQRTGSQLAVAVDPRDWRIVYLAWCDGTPATNYTMHLRRSGDGGQNWSADLRMIVSATNPGLAVNSHGKVALAYQQLGNPGTGNRWRTHLELSADGFATAPTDITLADVPDANGAYAGNNPIGDYLGLISLGKNFYGAFSANNTPSMTNFPSQVRYQRSADFMTNQLLDLAGNPVAASIDPFFFKWTEVAPEYDFYVRDWTDGPASGDNGIEPSTHPYFFATSDVWNRRGTLPGGFPGDQPEGEPAGNGLGNIGDNWAFCRIRRSAPGGGSQQVTAHFLVSKLGTGSNYVDASSMDADVSFPDPDPVVTFPATELGPLTTPAYRWHLNQVATTHLCLAVEISTPNDPYVAPSLVGTTPGWSTTTDLRVLDDNNKAQRNLGLSTTPARGEGASDGIYGIAHNASVETRDMQLRYEVPAETRKALDGIRVQVIGEKTHSLRRDQGVITLPDMTPGENRWIGLQYERPTLRAQDGLILPVYFWEVVGDKPVNGFALGAQIAPLEQALYEKINRHRSLLTRLSAHEGSKLDSAIDDLPIKPISKKRVSAQDYLRFVDKAQANLIAYAKAMAVQHGAGDEFHISRQVRRFQVAYKEGRVTKLAGSHSLLINALDALLTRIRLSRGDPADTLQMVRWEEDLFLKIPALAALPIADEVQRKTRNFIRAFGLRELTNEDYAGLLRELTEAHAATAKYLGRSNPRMRKLVSELGAASSTRDIPRMQRAHRATLLALADTRFKAK